MRDRVLESGCRMSILLALCLRFPAYKMKKGPESRQVLIAAQPKVLIVSTCVKIGAKTSLPSPSLLPKTRA